MKTDVQIASEAKMEEIEKIASIIGIDKKYLENYGKYKAKINFESMEYSDKKDGNLILVTAITPTPAGEGKTTVNIGLSMALNKLGKKTITTLREPSLGPCFGIKGGAAGGGYSQVLPMDDINLHFTGDIHAIGAANNLLAAMIDNHLHSGNLLNINPSTISWKRAVDINDRSLRNIVIGLGKSGDGFTRQDGFNITVASEIMAIVCLAKNTNDLREKISKIVVAYNYENMSVTCGDLKATGALLLLLKDAIKPNLVQTIENTPAIIHGGPFANIAHGCNSIIATKLALKLGDYVVTEAGFGADLGAEKFFDIKCRKGEISPKAVVLVATIRALKMHGGTDKKDLNTENLESLKKGIVNLEKHIENISKFGVPMVVAINKFPSDTEKEISYLENYLKDRNIESALTDVFSKGSNGAIDLAEKVLESVENKKTEFEPLYKLNISIKEKIATVAKDIYGASSIEYTKESIKQIKRIEESGFSSLPVCIAKTQYSFSDDAKLIGRPKDFNVTVREVRLSAGAGFIVVLMGSIMTMPGLPKKPAAEGMDIVNGEIIGLF